MRNVQKCVFLSSVLVRLVQSGSEQGQCEGAV